MSFPPDMRAFIVASEQRQSSVSMNLNVSNDCRIAGGNGTAGRERG